ANRVLRGIFTTSERCRGCKPPPSRCLPNVHTAEACPRMGVTKVTRNGTRVVTHRLCPRRTVAVTSEGASRTCGHWSGSSHRTISSLLFSRCALCGDDLLSCLPDPGPPGFLSS